MAPFETPWPYITWKPVTGTLPPCGAPRQEAAPRLAVLHRDRVPEPLDWDGRRLVLAGWEADLFDDLVPERFLFDVLDRILNSAGHLFVLLTARAPRAFTVVRRFVYTRGWLFTNFWLGVPVADQDAAERRLTLLTQTPVAGRFAWCLPPAPTDLSRWLDGLQWVAAAPGLGGEAASRLAEQCAAAGVPFFRAGEPEAGGFPPQWERFFSRGESACSR